MQNLQQKIFQIYHFFSYLLSSRHRFGYGVHSPAIFSFIHQVLRGMRKNSDFAKIRMLKNQLLQSRQLVKFTEKGAGSVVLSDSVREIRSIVKYSSTWHRYGRVLYYLARWMNARSVLELGTSVGIGTAYLSFGVPDAGIVTLEGDGGCAALAEKHLKQLGCTNVTVHQSEFDAFIDRLTAVSFDLIFIDGNHTYEATLRYFEKLLPHLTKTGWMVFDDIYWSEGMMKAWRQIQNDERVQISIDLYKIGLISCHTMLTPGHYRIAY